MKLLLSSSGAKNTSIEAALVDLLGKPIAESHALVVVTGIYPFAGGPYIAYKALCGDSQSGVTQSTNDPIGLEVGRITRTHNATKYRQEAVVPRCRGGGRAARLGRRSRLR